MTPKEKAKELISKMYGATPARESSELIDLDRKTSIQCALITVDEILQTITECSDKEIVHIHLIYWRKVQDELLTNTTV